ncbi:MULTISPECIES: MerR family transcriptional regulator [Staphylococcus]|uniref:MerR family transcriptional regulator n=1 Tax=Staphylococcus hsinchuensis TaxID=3051183 RepID=A0ABZ3EBT7_9STAP|nr:MULTISPECIES: MerR family transcriptional regulator [unclassified Staphylococcus]
MEYTVSELAKISGVSPRTLRYYDEIDLLKPSRINQAGYRIYQTTHVDVLQQIVFYRELDLSLQQIKKLLNEPSYNQIETLDEQHRKLTAKRDRLDQILTTIEKTLAYHKGKVTMNDNEKFEGFKQDMIDKNEALYGDEIREKYGNDMIDKSNAKVMGMSEKDFQQFKQLEHEILELLADAYQTQDPTSEEAQLLADKHRQWLTYTWPRYTKEAHLGLAEMYIADERFTAYYDKHVKGGTQFLRDAIAEYVNK